MPSLAINKYARSQYAILETFQAGIQLKGAEVKSAKLGHVNLKGSYISVHNGHVSLVQAHIAHYPPASGNPASAFDTYRVRKLLLNTHEIDYLNGKTHSANLTIIPLKMYTKGGLIKVEIGLARGLKKHDKREILKKRSVDKDIRRTLKYQ